MNIDLNVVLDWMPALMVIVATVLMVLLSRWYIGRSKTADRSQIRFRQQIWSIVVAVVGLLLLIFFLPARDNQDVALGVIGLVVTGVLALSSQSIITNGMAGLLLHSLGNFKPGDFIEVSGNLGRVSEVGLFHTEIQTPDRDLTTIPNSLMMTQPVKVVRASGTIVSATVSIGYDVSRHQLDGLFVEAAESAGLSEPFVQISELGDYAVSYRIAGFLEDPRRLLGARSDLRGAIIDTLSTAEIEIMSPMYVARRDVNGQQVLPDEVERAPDAGSRKTAEDKVFDKAELASGIQTQKRLLAKAEESIVHLKAQLAELSGDGQRKVQGLIETEERRIVTINARIGHLDALHAEKD